MVQSNHSENYDDEFLENEYLEFDDLDYTESNLEDNQD